MDQPWWLDIAKHFVVPFLVPVVFGDHVKDRDVVPHDLGGYDE